MHQRQTNNFIRKGECYNEKTIILNIGNGNYNLCCANRRIHIDCKSLITIYYRGSEEDRAKITIGSDNEYLTDATWYYNSCINAPEHSYDDACDTDCNICGFYYRVHIVIAFCFFVW